jgi:hypothetical protein
MLPIETNQQVRPEKKHTSTPMDWSEFKALLLRPDRNRPSYDLPESFIMGDLLLRTFDQDCKTSSLLQYIKMHAEDPSTKLVVPYRLLLAHEDKLRVSSQKRLTVSLGQDYTYNKVATNSGTQEGKLIGISTASESRTIPLLTEDDVIDFMLGNKCVRMIVTPVDVSVYVSTSGTPHALNSYEAKQLARPHLSKNIVSDPQSLISLGIFRYQATRGSNIFHKSNDLNHPFTLALKDIYVAYPHIDLQNHLLAHTKTSATILAAQERGIEILDGASKTLLDARHYLLDNIYAIQNGATIPGVVDAQEQEALVSWMNNPQVPAENVRRAYKHILAFVADQYEVTPEEIEHLIAAERDAFFNEPHMQDALSMS